MIYRPWTGTNKPPLGVSPIPGHALTPTVAFLMNEGSGDRANDALGKVMGTVSLADWVPDGLDFDGIDDVVTIPAGGECGISLQDWSIVWRAYLRSVGSWKPGWFDARENGTNNYRGWGLSGDSNSLALSLQIRSAAATGVYSLAVGVGFAFKLWATHALTVDRDGLAHYYVNGISQGSVNVSTSAAYDIAGLQGLRIGNQYSPTFGADAIYAWAQMYVGTVLSPTQVQAIVAQPYQWLGVPDLAAMWAAQAVAAGHPALRRLGLFDTGFGFDRSRETRWG